MLRTYSVHTSEIFTLCVPCIYVGDSRFKKSNIDRIFKEGIDDVTISSIRRQTDSWVPDDVLYLTKSMSSRRLFYSSGTVCQGQQSKATDLKRYHGHPDTPPIWTELLNAAQNNQRNLRNQVLWSVLSPIPVVDGYLLVNNNEI